MSWNYRVCKYKSGEETLYGIKEVYYESDNVTIKGISKASVDNWTTEKELHGTLLLMTKALEKPILIEE